MYSYPFPQAAPLVNALLQTLLLLACPLAVASVLGGFMGMWMFFHRHPLLSRSAKLLPAGVKPLPCLRSLSYLGLLPMLLLLTRRIPGMADGTMVLLLLSLGATVFLAFHAYSGLSALNASILEMALASGLTGWALILRVLLPLGKSRLLHALCETALFLLAMGAVAGCTVGGGLTGLAVSGGSPGPEGFTLLLSLLLLASLFLLIGWLSSHFAKNKGK